MLPARILTHHLATRVVPLLQQQNELPVLSTSSFTLTIYERTGKKIDKPFVFLLRLLMPTTAVHSFF